MSGGFFWDSYGAAAAILFIAAAWGAKRWKKRFPPPHVAFSLPAQLAASGKITLRQRWHCLPLAAQWLALIFFAFALCDLRIATAPQNNQLVAQNLTAAPIEGVALYLLLDQSGSMSEKVLVRDVEGNSMYIPKIQLLKQVTRSLVIGDSRSGLEGLHSDMVGIIALARSARVILPLTLDQGAILNTIEQLQVLTDKGSAGTVIGYAIFKGASLIAATRHYAQEMVVKGSEPYTLRDAAMIVVTDGFQDPNPLDSDKELRNIPLMQAAEYARSQGVRLYIVGIDPQMAQERFVAERRLMERVTAAAQGRLFLLEEGGSIKQLYREIQRLEKSRWYGLAVEANEENKQEGSVGRQLHPIYMYLVAIGMAFLAAAILLETLLLRRWP